MPLVTFDHDFATFFGRSVAIAHAVSARRALLDAETVFSALDRALGYPAAISGSDTTTRQGGGPASTDLAHLKRCRRGSWVEEHSARVLPSHP